MTNAISNRSATRNHTALTLSAFVGTLFALTAAQAQAQQAIGMPFIGANQLSVSVTELSRDGIGSERTTVFGAVYGRRFGSNAAPLQHTMILRVGARPVGTENGIVDAGVTLGTARTLAGGLSVAGAAGVNAMVWGRGANQDGPDTGRVIVRAPVSAGLAYDIAVGGATVAPFVSLAMAYSSEREYVDDLRIATDNGWRLGNTAGVSIRFRETVLSISGVSRERGLPNGSRVLFTAGMSW